MRRIAWTALTIAGAMLAGAAEGAPVRIFRAQTGDAFLEGVADGVAVEDDGALRLARRAEPLATIEAPFAFALARTKSGWAVGTGNEGHVYEVDAAGKSKVLFDAPEAEIFALWVDPDGTLFAGSSPDGKVYRVTATGSEVWFDPEESYIWAIARGADGALWVATGNPGRLYRLREKGKGERVWDGGATHVRSLLPLPDGQVLFGTAGDGRLLRWKAGKTRTLLDSELNEVVALAPGPDGSAWVALLASEASFVDLAPRAAAAAASGGDDASKGVVTVEEGAPAAGSRPAAARTPRSQILRLLPSGATEAVWTSTEETIFALLPEGDRLWAGTGLEGRLYLFEKDQARIEKVFTAKQVVALAADPAGLVALTANGSALSRLVASREAKGNYTSPALDAGQPARFGVFRWLGELPKGTRLTAEFRSGFSSGPDATWSDWSPPRERTELSLDGIDRGRFVQYRLAFQGAAGETPRVASIELSYRQENLRPEITSLVALDPGQILVPAGFNAADQLYEPASPNRQGIFDTLRITPPPVERMKGVWRKGWRTLKWDASDSNGDELTYRLEVRRDGNDGPWLELGRDLSEETFAFDATALPDGLYRFRLTASDEKGNEGGAGLSRTLESEPVLIDQTPPVLVSVQRGQKSLTAVVADAANPLRAAEVSIDGADWRPASPVDGLLDGRRETLVVDELPAGARLVLLRVSDAAFNVRTFDLLAEVQR